jgi:hypothetical protein
MDGKERDRDEILIVDALGPVYSDKVKRILTSDDTLYYSKGGAWVAVSNSSVVAHKDTHVAGGSDEFADGDLLKATARVGIRKNSTGSVFSRRRLNFIEGTNVTLTVADDAGNEEVDITIAASGGGGGAPDSADYWVETANGSLSAEVVVGTTGITTAAYASRQAAAKAGRLFLPSDGVYVQRDTGSAWASWGPLYRMTPPVLGDFTQINFGSASAVDDIGAVYLFAPSNGGAQNLRMLARTLPSAPYTVTVCILPLLSNVQFSQAAFGLRNSANDDAVLFKMQTSGATSFEISYEKWNSNSSGGVGNYIAQQAGTMMLARPIFLRFEDDNTNRILSWGADGKNFLPLHSVGRTDFVTPDQAFIGLNPYDRATGITLYSWKQ